MQLHYLDLNKPIQMTPDKLVAIFLYSKRLLEGAAERQVLQTYFPPFASVKERLQTEEWYPDLKGASVLASFGYQALIDLAVDATDWNFIDLLFDGDVVYSAQTCAEVIASSLQAKRLPRIMPEIRWPNRNDCVPAFSAVIPSGAFTVRTYAGSYHISPIQKGLRFEVFGERGEPEHKLDSEDPSVIYWSLFKKMISYDQALSAYNAKLSKDAFLKA